MADEKQGEAFLSRWSRLKKEEAAPKPPAAPEAPAPALPPVEECTPQSDFTGFMHPKVEDALRRVALKKLFSDPHFNAPDLFEPYSGDWTVGEAIPPEMLAGLEQVKTMLKQPPEAKTGAQEAAETQPEPQPDEPGKQDA